MAALTWYDDRWHEEQPRILGPLDHAFWMASVVFDGARAFEGLVLDLDRHCARAIDSARKLLLEPTIDAIEIERLCREGMRRFPPSAELYIRPMFFAMTGFVTPDPASTRFVLVLHEEPMPEPSGTAVCFSDYRRPARDAAPTDAKASCLYPNMQRALADARRRGFGNAVTLDANGNVAELATANLWIVRGGGALTPVCNGTFLDGITRQRVLALLRADGIEAQETDLTRADLMEADEIFSTGNWGKVLPITRLEDRALPIGPVTLRARALYWAPPARTRSASPQADALRGYQAGSGHRSQPADGHVVAARHAPRNGARRPLLWRFPPRLRGCRSMAGGARCRPARLRPARLRRIRGKRSLAGLAHAGGGLHGGPPPVLQPPEQAPLFLFGESLGGSVVLAAMAACGSRPARGLILVEPAMRNGVRLRYVWDVLFGGLSIVRPGLTRDLPNGRHPLLTDAARRRLAEDPRIVRHIQADAYKGLLKLADLASSAARRLTVPTLLLYGRADGIMPARLFEHAERDLAPVATVLRYPHAPHLLLQAEGWERVMDDRCSPG